MNQSMLTATTQASGRLLISAIFEIAGIDKLGAPAVTQGSRESMGVPGALLPLVILLELGDGLSVLLGWWTRIDAFLLAGFVSSALWYFMSTSATGCSPFSS
jgi:putative oxidoreductase